MIEWSDFKRFLMFKGKVIKKRSTLAQWAGGLTAFKVTDCPKETT